MRNKKIYKSKDMEPKQAFKLFFKNYTNFSVPFSLFNM